MSAHFRPPNSFELKDRSENLLYCREMGASAAEHAISNYAPLVKGNLVGLVRWISMCIRVLPEATALKEMSAEGIAAWHAGWAEKMSAFLDLRIQGMK